MGRQLIPQGRVVRRRSAPPGADSADLPGPSPGRSQSNRSTRIQWNGFVTPRQGVGSPPAELPPEKPPIPGTLLVDQPDRLRDARDLEPRDLLRHRDLVLRPLEPRDPGTTPPPDSAQNHSSGPHRGQPDRLRDARDLEPRD